MQINDTQHICHLEGSINYTIVHFNNGRKEMMACTLKKFEAILSESKNSHFIRIHKSYLVNKNSIKEIKPRPLSKVVLTSGLELPLARRRKIK
ncbi:MAG: LytR/AlgR family response regulator transcription factor [Emticicia sp.]|uniref:LytR/AlgR family response regulator transcription factor n=1 Tax=Emticicia sp. TaxID=1930953 RepID=UPI003BA5087F